MSKKTILKTILLGIATVSTLGMYSHLTNGGAEIPNAKAEAKAYQDKQTTRIEQQSQQAQDLIVRYGKVIVNNYGDVDIETLDGNIWLLTDLPEYPVGTYVRVLMDGNHTIDPDDDVVLDITEFDWTK